MTTAKAGGAEIEAGFEGSLGVIALDRPRAINALTRAMVQAIAAQLEAWRTDARVGAVLFEGRGPRGFCSGGDVRAVRDMMLAGRREDALGFFADEYRMNGLIAGWSKPLIALTHGIVMGGGIGIAGHADFRITAQSARFAMPEAAIGFVCDVGVNAILARAPAHRALLFELTGLPVGPADALALGLADCVIPDDRIGAVREALAVAAGSSDVETAIVGIMEAESIDAGEPELCALADRLAEALAAEDAGTIVAEIGAAAAADARLAPIAATLRSRCPTSLEAILQSHRAARELQDVGPILDLDLRLAGYMAQRADFAEGVRAVLIDKDQRPLWRPDTANGVAGEEIAAVVGGAGSVAPDADA